ncbi:hypothetical protein ACFUCV_06645 [Specibacter sp. NPDC057265]|uniref:hypothetical protein n=1 Tax=Specibacter sp. NPDC057265 TaxID=3346075 RepID=UPI00363B91C1
MTSTSGPPPDQARGFSPDLGKPALSALQAAGIKGYEDLSGWSVAELLALHGVGPKAIRILGAGLAARNACFAPGPPVKQS